MRDFSNFCLTTITFGEILLWNSTKQLDLNHPTQRNSVWSVINATKFIESILQNFPFEPIYVVKNKEGYSIIDGKQRISMLLLFMGVLREDAICADKTKKSDKLIEKDFALSFGDLSDDFTEKYVDNENEKNWL